MAEDLDDGEFWLPSQFLTDEEDDHHHLLMNRIHNIQFGSYGVSGSPLLLLSKRPTSPLVESAMMMSSTTLTDRDNHLTGPTCQIPHSKLKERVMMSGSPKSPLCDIGNWSAFSSCSSSAGGGGGGEGGSSRGSPICSSLVSSPPSSSTPPLNVKQEDPLDLLNAAAGQIGRLKEEQGQHNRPPTKKLGLFSNQALVQQQLQAAHQFQQRKQQQQQLLKQQLSAPWGVQGKVVVPPALPPKRQQQQLSRQQLSAPWGVQGKVVVPPALPQQQQQQQQQQVQSSSRRCARPFGMASSSSTRQPLHQQQGSGTSRESCGTGVFIPRRSSIPAAETLKKPAGCPAVLVPAKVVQAPNLSSNAMGGDTGVLASNEHVKCSSSIQQTRTASDAVILSGPHHHPKNVASHEICLPKEWTY